MFNRYIALSLSVLFLSCGDSISNLDDISQDDIGQDDISQDDIGQDDISQDDIGQDDIGQDDVNAGQADVGQDDIGQDDVGQAVFLRPKTGQPAYPDENFLANYVTLSSGYRVHYLDEGTGDTPILLVHGLPTQAYLWRKLIPVLAQETRVIAIDLPNFGYSDKTPDFDDGVPCTGAYADWIAEFIDALNIDHLYVVAHDVGFTGLSFAARNQRKIKGLAMFELALGPIPREFVSPFLERFLGPDARRLLLDENALVEEVLFQNYRFVMSNPLSETSASIYRGPFLNREDRLALLYDNKCLGLLPARPTDPGSDEQKALNFAEFKEFGDYIATTTTARLVLFGNPGSSLPIAVKPFITGQVPNGWTSTQTLSIYEMNNRSLHFWQEESNGAAEETAQAIVDWIRGLK